MRGTSQLFLLGVLVAVVVALDSRCTGKNQFLASMSKATPFNVEIFKHVKFVSNDTSTTCAAEWKVYGTCCDRIDLVAFYKHEQAFLREHRLGSIAQSWEVLSILQQGSDPKLASKAKGLMSTLSVVMNLGHKCHEGLLSLRGPALCSICSGRSQIFFSEDKKKALIDMETCSSVLNACNPYYLAFGQLSKSLEDLMSKSQSHLNSYQIANLNAKFESFKAVSPLKELTDAFAAYNKAEVATKSAKASKDAVYKRQRLTIKLCSAIANINKKPFVEKGNVNTLNAESEITLDMELERRFMPAFETRQNMITDVENNVKECEAVKLAMDNQKAADVKAISQRSDISQVEKESEVKKIEQQHSAKLAKHSNECSAKTALIRKEAEQKQLVYANKNKDFRDFLEHQSAGARLAIPYYDQIKIFATDASASSQLSIPSSGSRSLNLLQVDKNAGFSDLSDSLVLLKTNDDNMWKAFDGAPGTQLAHENSPLRAMNLSLAFP